MKICIIGASGFVGKYLVSLFLSEPTFDISVWNRKIDGDFLNTQDQYNFFQKNHFNVVINLAWNSINDRNYRDSLENQKYSSAAINFTKLCPTTTKLIHLSSIFADDPSNMDNYSISKRILQQEILNLDLSNVIIVKPQYIFSIEERRPHIVGNYIEHLFNPKIEFKINNPNLSIDFTHVKDIAEALKLISVNTLKSNLLYISSGLNIKVSEFLKLVEMALLKKNTSNMIDFKILDNLDEKTIVFNRETLRLFCNST